MRTCSRDPRAAGSSRRLAPFAAALLCKLGGCGECRDCRLALEDRHPNEVVVEPEGRDIHVETVPDRDLAPGLPDLARAGPKGVRDPRGDRLNPSAADVLLKVLEEPPADAVLMLLSARPDELPETILSRCHVVSFRPLSESFVAQGARGRGDRGRPGGARGPPGGGEPRAGRAGWVRRPTGCRSGRPPATRSSASRPGRPGRSRRPSWSWRPPSSTARTSGPSSRRNSRRSWTSGAAPRTRTGARSGASRSGTSARSAGPSATTSTACCSACRRCSETASRSRWAAARTC
jgi:hypothetical protein